MPWRPRDNVTSPDVHFIFVTNTAATKAAGVPVVFSLTAKDGVSVAQPTSTNFRAKAGILMDAATTTQTNVRCQTYGLHVAVKVKGGTTSEDITPGMALVVTNAQSYLIGDTQDVGSLFAVALSTYAAGTVGTIKAQILGVL